MNKWNTVPYRVIFHAAYYCWRNVRNVREKVWKKTKQKKNVRFRATFVLAAENESTNLPVKKGWQEFQLVHLPLTIELHTSTIERYIILFRRKTKTHFLLPKISHSTFNLKNEIALTDTELKSSDVVQIFRTLYWLAHLHAVAILFIVLCETLPASRTKCEMEYLDIRNFYFLGAICLGSAFENGF